MRFILFCLLSLSLYANEDYTVDIPNVGQIRYEYEGGDLVRVRRLTLAGQELYVHAYHYDDDHRLISETLIGDLGEIQHPLSSARDIVFETCDIIREYDDHGNLIRKSSAKGQIEFSYDALDRLIRAITAECEVLFTYDEDNRRNTKTIHKDGTVEIEVPYYIGNNEIALFSQDGHLKQLRIPGLTYHPNIVRPIAIEIGEDIYAPILDAQGNILKLINLHTKEVISYSGLDPHGSNLDTLLPLTPWIFAGKHYDKEIGLVYFGARYYDPESQEWTQPIFLWLLSIT